MTTDATGSTPPGPREPRRRSRTWAALLAIAAAFACSRDESVTYGPARDDAAMAAIASAWTEGGGDLTLSLCEDTARSAAWTGSDGCVVDHVVRGGGLGLAHTESHPEGGCTMGGCPWNAVAYVAGTVSSAALGGERAVAGEVSLDAEGSENPYAHPYRIQVTCADAANPCALTGTLAADGTISATLVVGPYGPGQAETPHALARAGASACP
jgi:hypothetical protein